MLRTLVCSLLLLSAVTASPLRLKSLAMAARTSASDMPKCAERKPCTSTLVVTIGAPAAGAAGAAGAAATGAAAAGAAAFGAAGGTSLRACAKDDAGVSTVAQNNPRTRPKRVWDVRMRSFLA